MSVNAKEAIERCRRGEAAARAFSPKVTNSEGATYGRVVGASALASSDGFAGSFRGTYQSLVVEPICDDADGKKRNGHWWTADRFLAKLQTPEEVGQEAARRTVAKLGSEKIATGELPVVFDPEAGRALSAAHLQRHLGRRHLPQVELPARPRGQRHRVASCAPSSTIR